MPMTKYIVSVDLGGTNLKVGLFNQKIKLKDRLSLSTKSFARRQDLIRSISDSIGSVTRRNRLSNNNILGIGLGLPGPTDYQKGVVHFFPNIPGWKNVNLKKILARRLKKKLYFENDANLMALAEFKMGAAKGEKNVVALTLGTGVGAGIIIGGRLYRGESFAAGEIGHIPLNEKGPLCTCGGQACIERYIGNQEIINQAKQVFKRKLGLEELSQLARQGNPKAIKIWQRTGQRLGVTLSGVVNLLNPDCIVIGGGVSKAGKVLYDSVKQTIRKRAMPIQSKHVKILRSKLGTDAGIIGAAIVVKHRGVI